MNNWFARQQPERATQVVFSGLFSMNGSK